MATPPKKKNPGAGMGRKGKAGGAAPDAAAVEGAALKKKDFFARVTAALGDKKANPKEVMDAVLKALGDAAHAGEDLILPPLGRIRVVKPKEGAATTAAGAAVTLKLRRAAPGADGSKKAKQPLAEESEAS